MSDVTNPSDAGTTFMITSFQEAHSDLRDALKRMSDHLQFFITISTAVFAGALLFMDTKATLLNFFITVFLASIVMSLTGIFTFIRIVSIKRQGAGHVARAECFRQYFLDNNINLLPYFQGRITNLHDKLSNKELPFTNQFVFLSHLFGIFNGVVMALSVIGAYGVIVNLVQNNFWQPTIIEALVSLAALIFGGWLGRSYTIKYLEHHTDLGQHQIRDILIGLPINPGTKID